MSVTRDLSHVCYSTLYATDLKKRNILDPKKKKLGNTELVKIKDLIKTLYFGFGLTIQISNSVRLEVLKL